MMPIRKCGPLPRGWLQPSWVEEACRTVPMTNGKSKYEDQVVENTGLFEWIVDHIYPNVTPTQYRTAVKRLLQPAGVGYVDKSAELDPELLSMLRAAVKKRGGRSWAVMRVVKEKKLTQEKKKRKLEEHSSCCEFGNENAKRLCNIQESCCHSDDTVCMAQSVDQEVAPVPVQRQTGLAPALQIVGNAVRRLKLVSWILSMIPNGIFTGFESLDSIKHYADSLFEEWGKLSGFNMQTNLDERTSLEGIKKKEEYLREKYGKEKQFFMYQILKTRKNVVYCNEEFTRILGQDRSRVFWQLIPRWDLLMILQAVFRKSIGFTGPFEANSGLHIQLNEQGDGPHITVNRLRVIPFDPRKPMLFVKCHIIYCSELACWLTIFYPCDEEEQNS